MNSAALDIGQYFMGVRVDSRNCIYGITVHLATYNRVMDIRIDIIDRINFLKELKALSK